MEGSTMKKKILAVVLLLFTLTVSTGFSSKNFGGTPPCLPGQICE
jgi:hypothetical protein